MRYNCVFNPDMDLSPVESGLALDLPAAIDSGVVIDTGVSPESNGIESHTSIIGRVRDAFEVIDAQRAVFAAVKRKPEGKPSPVSNQPAPAVSD